MPHEEFNLRWCSTEVPMIEEDAILEYDSFAASGAALTFCDGGVDFSGIDEPVLLRDPGFSFPHGNVGGLPPASYAQQRISYLVKIVANLHCFVPDLCEGPPFYMTLLLHPFPSLPLSIYPLTLSLYSL